MEFETVPSKIFRSGAQRGAAAADLAGVRQIKRFKILERPLSIENGELTPTLKVKRNVVRRNFAPEIDALCE